ncbi:hypothetical protein JQ617_05360 [Bradyrhizobium sp. KB893862 SZCCT0404]|uniref:hypothetical protein n=1 Tax=Bradyrhizobium sp. KB893862 SZCCT0404 TaxID=2807672 RepID=UPI001BA8BB20|nr:hypothetical protein [Bradyrhizobium sp. KB893862 SZCCT0404]MBR1173374.1 hypothetical protein [Bradyrhizobium sp. KB893862 SZCCT0404]
MFRHVVDNAGQPDDEHPRQGALPVLKLVWQPSTQLPEMLSSFASLVTTDVGAASIAVTDVSLVDDDRRGTAPWATAGCRVGLLRLCVWLGASTVTAGSVVRELLADVAACETAMPPGPHVNSAMQEQATVRRDKDPMTTSSQFAIQSRSTVPCYSQFTRVSRAPYTSNCRHAGFVLTKAASRGEATSYTGV